MNICSLFNNNKASYSDKQIIHFHLLSILRKEFYAEFTILIINIVIGSHNLRKVLKPSPTLLKLKDETVLHHLCFFNALIPSIILKAYHLKPSSDSNAHIIIITFIFDNKDWSKHKYIFRM